jgi:hypothetical protein
MLAQNRGGYCILRVYRLSQHKTRQRKFEDVDLPASSSTM